MQEIADLKDDLSNLNQLEEGVEFISALLTDSSLDGQVGQELENLNDSRVEKALIYLSRTDQEHAELSGEVKRCEEAIKQAKAHAFLLSSGTVAERDAQAIDSPSYKNCG